MSDVEDRTSERERRRGVSHFVQAPERCGGSRMLVCALLALVFCLFSATNAHAWGWAVRDTSRQSSENPTIYLGDSIEFAWDVNADGWSATYKKAGAGTNNTSAGMNWQDIVWVDDAGDGFGNNEGVKSASFQGTSVNTWYYSLWLGWGSSVGDNGHWYNGSSSWNEGSGSFVSSSFTVSALTAPSSPTATKDGTYPDTRIDLGWTQWNSKNVLIVRRKGAAVVFTPTNGTSYSASQNLGSDQTVVQGSQSGTSYEDTGLTPNTHYYYAFFSENYSYYSSGATADTTTDRPKSATWDGGGADNKWQTEANWDQNVSPTTGTDVVLYFAGSTRLTPTNDYAAGSDFGSIYFNSGASAFTIGGNGLDIYSKIENSDDSLQTMTNAITAIGASQLELNPVSGDLTFSGNVNNNGKNLLVYGGDNKSLTLSGVLSGSGELQVRPDGGGYPYVKITGASTYSGTTKITEGEVWLGAGATIYGASAGAVEIGSASYQNDVAKFYVSDTDGGTTANETFTVKGGAAAENRVIGGFNTSGVNTFSGTVTLEDEVALDSVNAGGTNAFTGVISGAYNAVKINPGTIRLTAENTFSGAMYINAGILELNNTTDPLDASSIQLGYTSGSDNATVQIGANSVTVDNAITVRSGSSGTAYIKNAYAGSGTFSGALTLQKNVTVVAISGSTLTLSGGTSGSYTETMTDAGTVDVTGSDDNAALSITVNAGLTLLNKTSSGSVHAIGNTLTIAGGTVRLSGSGGDQIFTDADVTITSGALDLNGKSEGFDVLTIQGTGINGGGAISNSSATASTITLAGDSELTGYTTIGGVGDIEITGNGDLDASSGDITLNKAGANTLTLTCGPNKDNGGLALNLSSGTVVLNKVSDSGSHTFGNITNIAGGIARLGGSGGDQIWDSGVVRINGGTFDLNGKTETVGWIDLNGTGAGGIGALYNSSASAGTVTLAGESWVNSDSTVGGTGDILIQGGGRLRGGGGNRALQMIGSGTLYVQNAAGSDNDSVNIVASSGTVVLDKTNSSSSAHAGSRVYAIGGTVRLNGTGDDQIWSDGELVSTNGGTFDMNGKNETVGTLTLGGTGVGGVGALYNGSASASILTIDDDSSMGADASVGGVGDIYIVGDGKISQGSGMTLTKIGNNTVTLSSGPGEDNGYLWVAASAGTLVLDKTNSAYGGAHAAGAVTVNSGGTVKLAGTGGGQIYEGATPTINSGGVLDMNGQNQTFDSAGPTISGTGISSGGALVNNNSTASTLSSALVLGDNSSIGGSGNLTISGAISGGSYTLTKVGANTLTLSGTSTYSGNTTVSAGTLIENGTNSSSALTVNSGTWLYGRGQVANLTISGLASAGNASNTISKLKAANVNLENNGVLEVGISSMSGTEGTDWDNVDASGNITVNATDGNDFVIALRGSPSLTTTQPYTNEIITVAGSAGNLETNRFTINTNLFTTYLGGGSFSVQFSGSSVRLVFAPLGGPDISVLGTNNVTISDGDTEPERADGTDFGDVHMDGNVSLTNTFTITNLTSSLLIISNGVAIGGTHASDFTVVQQPASVIVTNLIDTGAGFESNSEGWNVANGNWAGEDEYYGVTARGTNMLTLWANNYFWQDRNVTSGVKYTLSVWIAVPTNDGLHGDVHGEVKMEWKSNGWANAGTTMYTFGTNGSWDIILTPGAWSNLIIRDLTPPSSGVAWGTPVLTVWNSGSGGGRACFDDVELRAEPTFKIKFDPDGVGTRTATVYITNNTDGAKGVYSFAIQGTGTYPYLTVSPAALSPTYMLGNTLTAQGFGVTNTGYGALSYTVATNRDWLTVSTTSGTLGTGAGQQHTVSFASTGMPVGTHSGTITVTASGTVSNSPEEVSVSLTVTNIPEPTSVSATADGAEMVRLAWAETAGRQIMIVHSVGSALDASPTNGLAYAQGDSLGNGTVMYKGYASATVSNLEHIVTNGATHYYKLFAINNSSYYSTGTPVSATTPAYGPSEIVESFAYTNGVNVNTLSGGHGWTTAWSVTYGTWVATNSSIGVPDFADMSAYPSGGGNSVRLNNPGYGNQGFMVRRFAPFTNGTMYISVKLAYASDGWYRWCGISLLSTNSTQKTFFGETWGGNHQLGLSDYDNSTNSGYNLYCWQTGTSASTGNTYLLIARYDFASRLFKVKAYYRTNAVPVNEPLDNWDVWDTMPEGYLPKVEGLAVKAGSSDGSYYVGDCFFDDIRVAGTWHGLFNVADPVATNYAVNSSTDVTDAQVTSGAFSVSMSLRDAAGIETTNTVSPYFRPNFDLWNAGGIQILTDEVFSSFTYEDAQTVYASDASHAGHYPGDLGTYTTRWSAVSSNGIQVLDSTTLSNGTVMTFNVIDDDTNWPGIGPGILLKNACFELRGPSEEEEPTNWFRTASAQLGRKCDWGTPEPPSHWVLAMYGWNAGIDPYAWQNISVNLPTGAVITFTVRAKPEVNFDSSTQNSWMKLRFYLNGTNGSLLGTATTNIYNQLMANVDAWATYTFVVTNTYGAADTLACELGTMDMPGVGTACLFFDQVTLGARARPMGVWIGSTNLSPSADQTTNAEHIVTDGDLAQVGGDTPLRLIFGAYDRGSGLARGGTGMNVDIGTWVTDDTAGYVEGLSSLYADTFAPTATNTWQWTSVSGLLEPKTNAVTASVFDYDSDRADDALVLTNNQVGYLVVRDDDTAAPLVGPAGGVNLLTNPGFETNAGAWLIYYSSATNYAYTSAQAAEDGSYGLDFPNFRNTAGAGANYQQRVTTEAGTKITVGARVRTSGGYDGEKFLFKFYFWTDSGTESSIEVNVTNQMDTTWRTVSLVFTNAANVRTNRIEYFIFGATGSGAGRIQVDNAFMIAGGETCLHVRVGATPIAGSDSTTNAKYSVTDAQLFGNDLRMVFGAYDVGSGLSRNSAGAESTDMNVDVGTWKTDDYADYEEEESSLYADTFSIGATNTWLWASLSAADVDTLFLYNGGTNPITVSIHDADDDRASDRLVDTNHLYGYLVVTDDDTVGPVIGTPTSPASVRVSQSIVVTVSVSDVTSDADETTAKLYYGYSGSYNDYNVDPSSGSGDGTYTFTIPAQSTHGGQTLKYWLVFGDDDSDRTTDSAWSTNNNSGSYFSVIIQLQVARETFQDYTAGWHLTDLNGGEGWGNAWGQYDAWDNLNQWIDAANFANQLGCYIPQTDGLRLKFDGAANGRKLRNGRTLSSTYSGGKMYISWIQYYQNEAASRYCGLDLIDSGNMPVLGIGKTRNNSELGISVPDMFDNVSVETTNQYWLNGGNSYLMAVLVDFDADLVKVQSWNLGSPAIIPPHEPLPHWQFEWSTNIADVAGVRLQAGSADDGNQIGEVYFDELRIGTNWTEVMLCGGVDDFDQEGPEATLVYIGTNWLGWDKTQRKTWVYDGEATNTANLLDFAVAWYDPSGVYVTNNPNTVTNIGGENGRIWPNWDPVSVGSVTTAFGLDRVFQSTNPAVEIVNYGDNGDTSVTTAQYHAFVFTNTDFGVANYITVSAEDDDQSGTCTSTAEGDDVPCSRAITVNSQIWFTVADDDTNAPVVSSFAVNGTAQTWLDEGDIYLTGFNADGNDDFSFVTFVNIAPGTELRFTDRGWTNAWSGSEGTIIWTSPASILPAGSRVVVSDPATAGVTVDTGTVSRIGTFAFGDDGDQILVFQAGDHWTNFIFALSTDATDWWGSGADPDQNSGVPWGLEEGVSAVHATPDLGGWDDVDCGRYTGVTTGTVAAFKAAYTNHSNWELTDTGPYALSSADFDVPTLTDEDVLTGTYSVTGLVQDAESGINDNGLIVTSSSFTANFDVWSYANANQVVADIVFSNRPADGGAQFSAAALAVTSTPPMGTCGDADACTDMATSIALGTHEVRISVADNDEDRGDDRTYVINGSWTACTNGSWVTNSYVAIFSVVDDDTAPPSLSSFVVNGSNYVTDGQLVDGGYAITGLVQDIGSGVNDAGDTDVSGPDFSPNYDIHNAADDEILTDCVFSNRPADGEGKTSAAAMGTPDAAPVSGTIDLGTYTLTVSTEDYDMDRFGSGPGEYWDTETDYNVEVVTFTVADDDTVDPVLSSFDIPGSVKTNLITGQIVLVAYQSDDPDRFAMLALAPIEASTIIYFTDNGWSNSPAAFRTGEGTFTWTVPADGLAAGTVVEFTNLQAAGYGVSTGALAKSGSWDLAAGGDTILAYQGDSSSPTFLYGVTWASDGWAAGNFGSGGSQLPTALTEGITAWTRAGDTPDNGYYSGGQTGSFSFLQTNIGNSATWVTNDTVQTWPTWAFSVENPLLYFELSDGVAASFSLTGLVRDVYSGVYKMGATANSPTVTVYNSSGSIYTGAYFTTGPTDDGDALSSAEPLAVTLSLPPDEAVYTARVVTVDYDVDRANDSLTATQLVVLKVIGDDDTVAPLAGTTPFQAWVADTNLAPVYGGTGTNIVYIVSDGNLASAVVGDNLLLNPGFESSTNGGADAPYWTKWGDAGTETWASETGTWGMAFYDWQHGDCSHGGGFYQDINSVQPGSLYRFSIRGLREANLSATGIYVKLEFRNGGGIIIGGTTNDVRTIMTTSFATYIAQGRAPADAASIRVVVEYEGGTNCDCTDCSMLWDNAILVVATNAVRLGFGAYDAGSGILRMGVASAAESMSITLEALTTNNVVNFTESDSTPFPSTTGAGSTSVWSWVSFTMTQITNLLPLGTESATYMASATIPDADTDKAGDTTWRSNQQFGFIRVIDDDTNAPLFGYARPNTLMNPSFETFGNSFSDAWHWAWGAPDYHGGTWGNACRTNWHTVSGDFNGAIPGIFDDFTLTYGGWWQEVTNTFAAGTIWEASGWFWSDTPEQYGKHWTAVVTRLLVEFYDGAGNNIESNYLDFDEPGETWTKLSVIATSPAGAAWARWVVLADGLGDGAPATNGSGSLQFDDISLGPYGPAMDFWVGTTNYYVSGSDTGALFLVTDADLARVSAAQPMKFVFAVYDPSSGVSRSSAAEVPYLNYDVGAGWPTELQSIYATFSNTPLSDAQTTGILSRSWYVDPQPFSVGGTNDTANYSGFYETGSMIRLIWTITNILRVSAWDMDTDRGDGDRSSWTDQQIGLLKVTDDDDTNPEASNLYFGTTYTPGATSGTNLTDGQMLGGFDFAYQWYDPSGLFITNLDAGVTNMNGVYGNVNINWDLRDPNGVQIVTDAVHAATSLFPNVNGSITVTAEEYNVSWITYYNNQTGAWQLTVSAQDMDNDRGEVEVAAGHVVNLDRAVRSDFSLGFQVTDDDTGLPNTNLVPWVYLGTNRLTESSGSGFQKTWQISEGALGNLAQSNLFIHIKPYDTGSGIARNTNGAGTNLNLSIEFFCTNDVEHYYAEHSSTFAETMDSSLASSVWRWAESYDYDGLGALFGTTGWISGIYADIPDADQDRLTDQAWRSNVLFGYLQVVDDDIVAPTNSKANFMDAFYVTTALTDRGESGSGSNRIYRFSDGELRVLGSGTQIWINIYARDDSGIPRNTEGADTNISLTIDKMTTNNVADFELTLSTADSADNNASNVWRFDTAFTYDQVTAIWGGYGDTNPILVTVPHDNDNDRANDYSAGFTNAQYGLFRLSDDDATPPAARTNTPAFTNAALDVYLGGTNIWVAASEPAIIPNRSNQVYWTYDDSLRQVSDARRLEFMFWVFDSVSGLNRGTNSALTNMNLSVGSVMVSNVANYDATRSVTNPNSTRVATLSTNFWTWTNFTYTEIGDLYDAVGHSNEIVLNVRDADNDRAGDALSTNIDLGWLVVNDEDTANPAVGTKIVPNLVRNPSFEITAPTNSNVPWYWQDGYPDNMGNTAGNWWRYGSNDGWVTHSGLWEGTIPGKWGQHTYNTGGWYQRVTNAYGEGTVWYAHAWVYNDSTWTTVLSRLEIWFFDSTLTKIPDSGNVTAFTPPGENWTRVSVLATAPADCAFAEWGMFTEGMGEVGGLQFDDVWLGPQISGPLAVQIGSTVYTGNPAGSVDAVFEIPDGPIANVSETNPLILVFSTYDAGSGLSRGNSSASTQMNVTVENLATADVAGYREDDSTAFAGTLADGAITVWRWTNVTAAQVQAMVNGGDNEITATIFDTDDDRPSDRGTLSDQRFGYLRVVDDDTNAPLVGSALSNRAMAVRIGTEFASASGSGDSATFTVTDGDLAGIRGNLLTNPSFETNGAAWNIFDSASFVDSGARSGTWNVRLLGPDETGSRMDHCGVYQDINCGSGVTVTVQGYYRKEAGFTNGEVHLRLEFRTNYVEISRTWTNFSAELTTNWQWFSYTYTTPATTWVTRAVFAIEDVPTNSTTNASVFVDDVTFYAGDPNEFRILLSTYDTDSGISRDSDGPVEDVMNMDVGTWTNNDMVHYEASASSSFADSLGTSATSVWMWSSFAVGDIDTLYGDSPHTVRADILDADNDRVGDRMTNVNQQFGFLSVIDDDTAGPALSASGVTNLLKNAGFETAGSSDFWAYHWEVNNPDGNGGAWGNHFHPTNPVAWPQTLSGSCMGAIPGYWDGWSELTNGGGGWWQQVTNAYATGTVWEAAVWVWNDDGTGGGAVWTNTFSALQIEFRAYDDTLLSSNFFQLPPDGYGETWTEISVLATAPVDTAWARFAIYANGLGSGDVGALQFDNAVLRPRVPLGVSVGAQYFGGTDPTTNALYTISDGALASVNATNPLRFSFGAYDADSGLNRGTTGASTNMNASADELFTNNVTRYAAAQSTPKADSTNYATTVSTWEYTNAFSSAQIEALFGTQNPVSANIYDADADRTSDQLGLLDQLFGYWTVADDDTNAPTAQNLYVRGYPASSTNLTDQLLLTGDWELKLTYVDSSGVATQDVGGDWRMYFGLRNPQGQSVIDWGAFNVLYDQGGGAVEGVRWSVGGVGYTNVQTGVWSVVWSALDLDKDRDSDQLSTYANELIANSSNLILVVDDDTVNPTPPSNLSVSPSAWTNVNLFVVGWDPGEDESGIYEYRSHTNSNPGIDDGIPLLGGSVVTTYLAVPVSNHSFEVGDGSEEIPGGQYRNEWCNYSGEKAYWTTNAQAGTNGLELSVAAGDQGDYFHTPRYSLVGQDVYLYNTNNYGGYVALSAWFKGDMSHTTSSPPKYGRGALKIEFFDANSNRVGDPSIVANEDDSPVAGLNVTEWTNMILVATNMPSSTEFVRLVLDLHAYGSEMPLTCYWDNVSATIRLVSVSCETGGIFTNAQEGEQATYIFDLDGDNDRVGDRLLSTVAIFTTRYDATPPSTITGFQASEGPDNTTEVQLDWTPLTYLGGGGGQDQYGNPLSPWQSYVIYYTTNATIEPATDPYVTVTNGYTSLGTNLTGSVILSNLVFDTTYYFGIAGLDQAGNQGSVAPAGPIIMAGFAITQGVSRGMSGVQIGWTVATNSQHEITRVYDLLCIDALDWGDTLTNQWTLLATGKVSSVIDTGLAGLLPPWQLVNTMRFYRAAQHGLWLTGLATRVASVEIYAAKTFRLYRGQNWVSLPFQPDDGSIAGILGHTLPSAESQVGATKVIWYAQSSHQYPQTEIWLANNSTATQWQFSIGGPTNETADNFVPLPIRSFVIEIPTNATQPQVVVFVGRLPIGSVTGAIAGAGSYNLMSFRAPRRVHPSQMNLLESGFRGGSTARPLEADRIWTFSNLNQRATVDVFYDTNTLTWRYNKTPNFPVVPASQMIFKPDDGLVIKTGTNTPPWAWTNKILYTPPNRYISP